MLFKYSGKYVNIYFNMKITFPTSSELKMEAVASVSFFTKVGEFITHQPEGWVLSDRIYNESKKYHFFFYRFFALEC